MPVARAALSAAPADAALLQALAAVAEATCSAAALTDDDDRVAWVNAAFSRVTGWPLDEVRGRPLAALLQQAAGEDAGPWPQPQPIGAGAGLEQMPLRKLRRRCGTAYWARVDLRRLPAACAPLAHLHLHADVTEARGTTSQLRDALRRLRLATETSRIGAWERDLDTGVGHWDPTMFSLFGLPPSESAPSRAQLLELVHPDDRAGFRLTWKRLAAEPGPIEYECRVVRPDGRVADLVTRAMVERDADGRPRRALGTAIDLTALRRAERERDRLSQRMQLVAEAVGLGLWEYEPASRRSIWNDRMYALFGQTRDSFRERLWFEVVHPDDVDHARQAFERTVATGAPFEVEFRVVHGDGQTRWIAARGRGERDGDGALARVLGSNALAADIAGARAAGIGEYLTKPLDGAALLGCVDRLLADRR